MAALDFAPAALIALTVTAALAGAELMPSGDATVLVRVPAGGSGAPADAALRAAAAADAAFVGVPAPGFAVLHGDASRIRAALGLTTAWKGSAPCSPTP